MRKQLFPVLAALSVASALIAFAPRASAISSCSDVDLSATNNHPSKDPIKVVYLKYQVNGAGAWYKEDVDDKVPHNGNSVSWSKQKLQDLPVGSGAKFRVYFKRQLTAGAIPKYDDTRYQEFDRLGTGCTDGRSYTFSVTESGVVGE